MYKLIQSKIEGCIEILPNIFRDARGSNMKFFHESAFKESGLEWNYNEELIVISQRNVIRGMHMQNPPHPQIKLVTCVEGEVLDILVDLRKDSPTYGKHEAFKLSGEKLNMLYIPHGIAHGYCAISKKAIVCYRIAGKYSVEHETGIRWDSFGAKWPTKNPIVSDKDKKLPTLDIYKSEF